MPAGMCLQPQEEAEEDAYRRSLLRFPREIRNKIYGYVLAPNPVFTSQKFIDPSRIPGWNPRGPKFPGNALPLHEDGAISLMGIRPAYIGLMLSCRQLHVEVSSLLYNTVELDLRNTLNPEKTVFKLGPSNLSLIKHITIELRPCIRSPRGDSDSVFPAWRAAAVLRLLQNVGAELQTVTLKAPWHSQGCQATGWCGNTECMNLEPLLEEPSLFANVQTIIFPDFLALCPPRTSVHSNRPKRNQPLHQTQKDDIAERLGFQAETKSFVPYGPIQRSGAPLPSGFFVLSNPRDLVTSENTEAFLSKRYWGGVARYHMANLKASGLQDITFKWLQDNTT